MTLTRSIFLVGTAALITLSACTSLDEKRLEGSQYWQRVSVSEAVYQRGPKAQQILNRDISRCVVELRELERLGAVKNAIPAGISGRVLDPDQKPMDDWDSPERDKHLYAEHADYHDFEGCMLAKGWERIEHVPYDVSKNARKNHLKAHVDYSYESRVGQRDIKITTPAPGYDGDLKNVNE